MIYGYIRISTDKQTIENQRFEITKFCTEKNLQVDKWISETISGTKEVDKVAQRSPAGRYHHLLGDQSPGSLPLHDHVCPQPLYGNRCQGMDC